MMKKKIIIKIINFSLNESFNNIKKFILIVFMYILGNKSGSRSWD